VRLYNPNGLRSIAFAVPTSWIRNGALPAELRNTGQQHGYTILSVRSNPDNLDVTLSGGAPS
jgi:hypothetical protein